ncbi:hypothetical protein KFL_000400190 [Klebsormidium nitens]|uniref:Uncharacterized protein n=1 Tax=Klebsormidium nitens TaxID=105231 RepID=A0A1Y1HMM1_KLENI|nr:hypothetical protein KFL_000400190 [Klebsormidium nitens]|eukprot:GAQ79875.1 hypothetical protein KFL_000400190 [Klebsormidium nitens]
MASPAPSLWGQGQLTLPSAASHRTASAKAHPRSSARSTRGSSTTGSARTSRAATPRASTTVCREIQVTDNARLIAMAASTLSKFFPNQSDVLDALADAGVEAAITTVGGDFLKECIPINPGPRCRTWRLVAANSGAKSFMMRRFQQLNLKLLEAGLEASDWGWGTNKKF